MATWNDYRRRRNAAWIGGFAFLPVMFAVGLPLTSWFRSDVPAFVLFVAYALGLLILCNRAIRFPCPQCAKPYAINWLNLPAKQCQHCGLGRWHEPITAGGEEIAQAARR